MMGKLILDISTSLDGFVAGPRPTLEEPLGEGGEGLHQWAFATRSWRERHGLAGGEEGADSELIEEMVARTGATVMGRRMFSGGEGAWASDPNAGGWWGEDPPFHHPVFVLTRHARDPLIKRAGTTFTFATEGIEAALEQARAAAGERDVAIGGGANVAQQYLKAGLIDEVRVHVAPVLLGDGARLFEDGLAGSPAALRCASVTRSPSGVAHLSYLVDR
jgi:dihydrofolate reductase